jgi:hypothetical protein
MELERLSARIRPRRPWEAIDLGFALARQWFRPLWLLWWLTAAPIALLSLPWLYRQPDIWMLLIWWLKPLYESVLLLWLSRALFGDQPSVAGAWRGLRRAFPLRLWPQLLWRRLSPSRSVNMPVTLLEGLRGRGRRRRLRTLSAPGGAGGWLTMICVHMEAILTIAAILLLAVMIPDQLPQLDLGNVFFDDESALYWIAAVATVAAMSVIAPFYVAAGFAVYLGRRTELEAWDLELLFRREAARRRSRGAGGSTTMLLVGLAVLSLSPSPGGAAEPLSREDARTLIDEVLADDDFGRSKEAAYWAYIGEIESSPDDADADWGNLGAFGRVLAQLVPVLASVVKWGVALIAVVALVLLAQRLALELGLVRGLRQGPRRRSADSLAPVEQEAEPTAQILPDDVPAAVRELLARGSARSALGLLYRAQIAHLRNAGLDIPDSATEAECLDVARRQADAAQSDWLGRLTRLWQRAAYAHQPVGTAEVETLLRSRPTGASASPA